MKQDQDILTLANLYREVANCHITLAHKACNESQPDIVADHITQSRQAHMKAERLIRRYMPREY